MAANGTTRIAHAFRRARARKQRALIPFIMGGDPDLKRTCALVEALSLAGADIIEVGVPFSDPLADGPVIQRAADRALASGTTPDRLLRALSRVTARIDTPVVLLSYWNPILQFSNGHAAPSPSAFVAAAGRAGIAGAIVPDLSAEEGVSWHRDTARAGFATMFLAAPTSSPDRLRRIAQLSSGFVYYVSLLGTTGVRTALSNEWADGVKRLRAVTSKPICVGFGISTPQHAAQVAREADGVIIGSAVVRAIESAAKMSSHSLARHMTAWLRPFRKVV